VIEDSMLDLESIEFRVPLTARSTARRVLPADLGTRRGLTFSPPTSSGVLSLMH
jgi:hypothetical protein